MAEALAPGQGETLLQIVQSDSQTKSTQLIHETISNEMVQNLKQIYDFYVEHKMPFMEQVRLLSMLPRSWDLTILRMDSSEKYELPRRILQVQKAHVVLNYKKYCDESDFDGLCRTKLFDILNSIKPSQQQAVSGLDEFVVEGVEAWRSLSSMIQEMAIPQVDRKRLLKQMEMAEIYQKSRHIDHCSANSSCAIYCCTFGLSDPNCAQYYSACTQDLPYFGRKVKMSKIKISKATIIEMPKGTNTENDSV
ncbi:unnamed protein product [Rotaria sp. Silwood2]|nr:unnamed protein product [Rotaria sp. Silwood2]